MVISSKVSAESAAQRYERCILAHWVQARGVDVVDRSVKLTMDDVAPDSALEKELIAYAIKVSENINSPQKRRLDFAFGANEANADDDEDDIHSF